MPRKHRGIGCDRKPKPARAKLPNFYRKPPYWEVSKKLTTLLSILITVIFPPVVGTRWTDWIISVDCHSCQTVTPANPPHSISGNWTITSAWSLYPLMSRMIGGDWNKQNSFTQSSEKSCSLFFRCTLATIMNWELLRPRRKEIARLV